MVIDTGPISKTTWWDSVITLRLGLYDSLTHVVYITKIIVLLGVLENIF